MPKVTLQSAPAMNRETALRQMTKRLPKFWVAKRRARTILSFIPIGSWPAFHPLDLTIDLKPGDYLLGAGSGIDKLRKYFTVTERGIEWK